jgi:hypothetical protein
VNPPFVGFMEALDFFVICLYCNMKHCIALALQIYIMCLTKEMIRLGHAYTLEFMNIQWKRLLNFILFWFAFCIKRNFQMHREIFVYNCIGDGQVWMHSHVFGAKDEPIEKLMCLVFRVLII